MTAAVFIGPSLPRDEPWPADVERLPPAALGDVYRLASRSRPPSVIGLVDGYFERRPPVRHAEILWALSRGIRVLGAASIGALRAAELAPQGMEAVGAIAEAYRSGALFGEPLDADDEVAVSHGPAELGHPSLTVALVDVRASLAVAEAAGIVTPDERHHLVEAARTLHFKDRTWPLVTAPLPGERRAPLLAWLASHARSLKRDDATLLLRRVAALAAAPPTTTTAPTFIVTDAWLDFVDWAGGGEEADPDLLVALALNPPLRARVLRQALLRVLGRREALRRGRSGGDELATLTDLYGPLLARNLAAALDDLGERSALETGIARRRAARQALRDGTCHTAPSATALLAWHSRHLGQPMPSDLEAYARSLGLARGEQLLQALAEEVVAEDLP